MAAHAAYASPTFFGQVLVDWDHVWKYEPANTNLAPHPWTSPGYDDSTWISGLSVIGFPPTETLPPGQTNRTFLEKAEGQITVYLRTQFEWSRPEQVYLTFANLIDDGAVFYLNGTEVQRVRMREGEVGHHTLAAPNWEVTQGYDVFRVEHPPLVQGWNVLAVELHQSAATSADMVFAGHVRADQARPACGWLPTQHQSLTLMQCQSTNLTVNVDGFPEPEIYWYKDGVEVFDATNGTYSLTNVGAADEGTYVCREITQFRTCDLAVFTITVAMDVIPVYVEQAVGSLDATRVRIRFSEPMDEVSAGDEFAYNIPGLEIYDAGLSSDAREVLLTTSPRIRGKFYNVEFYGLMSAGTACGGSQPLYPAEVTMDLETVVLPFDAIWRYNDSGADLGSAWRYAQYDDSTWPEGPALLGFESTQATLDALQAQGLSLQTPLQFSTDENGIITHYFRTLVDLRFTPQGSMTLQHVVDDGAVFYVNGSQIGRFNMPEGLIVHSTIAPTTPSEGVVRSLPIAGLVPGTNVLAVEVHQSGTFPGDVLFGAQIVGVIAAAEIPHLLMARNPDGDITLSWAGRAVLEQTDDLSAPWQRAPNQVNPQTTSATEAWRFYRLRR